MVKVVKEAKAVAHHNVRNEGSVVWTFPSLNQATQTECLGLGEGGVLVGKLLWLWWKEAILLDEHHSRVEQQQQQQQE